MLLLIGDVQATLAPNTAWAKGVFGESALDLVALIESAMTRHRCSCLDADMLRIVFSKHAYHSSNMALWHFFG